jgi:hypothetical protein
MLVRSIRFGGIPKPTHFSRTGLLQANQKEAYVEMGKNGTFRLGFEMNVLFDPGFFPAFASKDLLLIMGLTFMAMGISQMAYCLLRMKQGDKLPDTTPVSERG